MGTKRRRGHRGYKFTEKTHSKKGIVAVIFSLAMIAMYVAFIALAFLREGGLSTYYGSAGVMAVIISVVMIVLSAQGMREENSFRSFPRLGLLFSIISVLCWVLTYLAGASVL
ncbi:MAG: DUF6142 family protein [Clostridiales bacterium]|nr:DUF6142 family protein [Clostridiales bacterium]